MAFLTCDTLDEYTIHGLGICATSHNNGILNEWQPDFFNFPFFLPSNWSMGLIVRWMDGWNEGVRWDDAGTETWYWRWHDMRVYLPQGVGIQITRRKRCNYKVEKTRHFPLSLPPYHARRTRRWRRGIPMYALCLKRRQRRRKKKDTLSSTITHYPDPPPHAN